MTPCIICRQSTSHALGKGCPHILCASCRRHVPSVCCICNTSSSPDFLTWLTVRDTDWEFLLDTPSLPVPPGAPDIYTTVRPDAAGHLETLRRMTLYHSIVLLLRGGSILISRLVAALGPLASLPTATIHNTLRYSIDNQIIIPLRSPEGPVLMLGPRGRP